MFDKRLKHIELALNDIRKEVAQAACLHKSTYQEIYEVCHTCGKKTKLDLYEANRENHIRECKERDKQEARENFKTLRDSLEEIKEILSEEGVKSKKKLNKQ